MSVAWKHLIRFEDENGNITFGEPVAADLKEAKVLEGSSILSLSTTSETRKVTKLLAPFVPDTILCIGLNYMAHAKEANFPTPKYPVLFHKSKNAVTTPTGNIVMPQICKSVDYENELCVVIGKDGKDISEDKALEHVLGYTVGNDVSSRDWQKAEAGGGQFCYAKSFDTFLPLGPQLVSAAEIPDPSTLKVHTKLNGESVQQGETSDLIFSVPRLIAFLSQGTTLHAGTMIMTGTPPGVMSFRKDPPEFLKAGDVVECSISSIGTLRNELQQSDSGTNSSFAANSASTGSWLAK